MQNFIQNKFNNIIYFLIVNSISIFFYLFFYNKPEVFVFFVILISIIVLIISVLKFSLISFSCMFIAVSFLYTFSAYVDYVLFQEKVFRIEGDYAFLVLLSCLFIFTFSCFSEGNKSYIQTSSLKISDSVIFFIYSISTFFFIIYLQKVLALDFSLASRGELLESRDAILGLLKFILPVFLCICLLIRKNSIYKRIIIYAAIILFVTIEVAIFGNRRLVVGLILFIIFFNRDRVKPYHYLIFFVLAVFFMALQVLRAYELKDWFSLDYAQYTKILYTVLNPMNTELGAYYNSGMDLLSNAQLIDNKTYLDIPELLLPSELRNVDTLSPAENYVKSMYPHLWARGNGLAYNFVIETFQNFNLLGPFIIGYLLSKIVSSFNRLKGLASVFILVMFYCNFIFIFRLALISSIKPMLIIFFILIVCIFINKLSWNNDKNFSNWT